MWSKLEKIFQYLVFAGIVIWLFGAITSLENQGTYFDYERKYITPSHIILIPIVYLLYGYLFKNRFVKILKWIIYLVAMIILWGIVTAFENRDVRFEYQIEYLTLSHIILVPMAYLLYGYISFFSIVGILFYNSYGEKLQGEFLISVLVTYWLYGIMFGNNFFKDIWSVGIKSFALMFVALLVIWTNNIGFQETVDQLTGWFLFIGVVFLFFKGISNMSPEDVEDFKRSNEETSRELDDLSNRLDRESKMNAIDRDIESLKYKRGKTYRNIIGGDLSPSELNHNQRYYDKLSEEIDRLKDEKDNLK